MVSPRRCLGSMARCGVRFGVLSLLSGRRRLGRGFGWWLDSFGRCRGRFGLAGSRSRRRGLTKVRDRAAGGTVRDCHPHADCVALGETVVASWVADEPCVCLGTGSAQTGAARATMVGEAELGRKIEARNKAEVTLIEVMFRSVIAFHQCTSGSIWKQTIVVRILSIEAPRFPNLWNSRRGRFAGPQLGRLMVGRTIRIVLPHRGHIERTLIDKSDGVVRTCSHELQRKSENNE